MLNPLGPCDPPLYPYCNTLPTPHHTSPHPCGCLYGHNQRNSCSYRGGVEGGGGGAPLLLPKRVNHSDCQGQRHVCCLHTKQHANARTHAHTDTHAERLNVNQGMCPCAKMCNTHAHTCAPENQTILVSVV